MNNGSKEHLKEIVERLDKVDKRLERIEARLDKFGVRIVPLEEDKQDRDDEVG